MVLKKRGFVVFGPRESPRLSFPQRAGSVRRFQRILRRAPVSMGRRDVVFQERMDAVPCDRRQEFVEGLAVRGEGLVPFEEVFVLGDDLQFPVVLRAGGAGDPAGIWPDSGSGRVEMVKSERPA